ncbi:unnamed protein product [Oppiella nova]|uniref:GST N-terminal domain-containing protein n=1 Tax=Oppiella nova TaxID=334625 RepID=A0A7R9M7C3_9ACAR|nr:unnamed protein product [Oppiella nova]CAG2172095.1 unnamed protein product [Oppiella nova]
MMSHLANNLKKGDPYPPRANPGLLRVYSDHTSPFAQRVLMVLTAKDIPHEVIHVNIWDKPDWFVERNPLGKVPTIEFGADNKILYESLVIADYLDETLPGKRQLRSTDPYTRASDRVFIETINEYFVGLKYVFTEPDLTRVWDSTRAALKKANDLLAKRRVGAKYLSGAELPGLTDYMIAPLLHLLPLCVDLSGHKWDDYFRTELPEFN